MQKTLIIIALLLTSLLPAYAHEEKSEQLVISHPWSRATAASQKVGAVFMEVRTRTGHADRLINAATPDAETVEIHTHMRTGDVMRMRRIDGINIPAEGSATLEPGSMHLMLIGLKAPLFEETVFPMTLTFENAGTVDIEVIVEAAGAGKPSPGMTKTGDEMPHHGHGTPK